MATSIPLAERIRPKALDDIIGQSHLLGENAPISKMVAEGYLPSMILHGNAGIGKTTLASLLANSVGREFRPLSAINSGVKELRKILTPSDGLFATPPVVFVDEIHRFNKAQQDALLGAVESGQITLIGATTENPSFSVNNALLSRCQVYKLEPLSDNEIFQIIKRAITIDEQLKKLPIVLNDISPIYGLAQGDARRALNLLELAIYAYQGEPIIIDFDSISKVAGQTLVRYDKDGDMHYDIISAFIKSVRGSDPDASIYWLARMLVAGEDPAFIARRLVILASEDIGLANPNALLLADTALRSVKEIGMPEARIILGQVAIYLATSPKSNESYKAINKAIEFAKTDNSPVPLHLRNGVTTLMKSQGYGVDYIYPHDYPNHYYPQNYLPDNLIGMQFYEFGDNQKEQSSFNFLNWLKGSVNENR
ncbi:replication-associated recombination protein A [Moraxella equi]|uniref:Replication-associated recombination protein A n=1 Tax=Moraxella equi TaxID=60442 RepID=A0A378QVR3_9GAMM|nr:replication-associated recombination protein A [Moraxella equi]OPH36954.1 AAA family ATPase [Moraxella equi]STZ04384.1 Replication-associated recombination protein A [Moraxella equi]